MSKTAIVDGVTGQDGFFLSSLLLSKGYVVVGIMRRTSNPGDQRIGLIKHKNLFLVHGDITDASSIQRIIDEYQPDEYYHLAAMSHVGLSFKMPETTTQINCIGTLNTLEAVRLIKPNTKYLFAASSEMHGDYLKNDETAVVIDENSPLAARSPYGASKIFGYKLTQNYRESYGMFASSSICFNHESCIRGVNFVTRKIAMGVANIKKGLQKKINLGNIESSRDWGFAGDYTDGMFRILQHDKPDDFVIATGKTYSVRDFLRESFRLIDIENYMDYVNIDKDLLRPSDIHVLIGDSSKARDELRWEHSTSFEELVRMMVFYELEDHPYRKRLHIGDELLKPEVE